MFERDRVLGSSKAETQTPQIPNSKSETRDTPRPLRSREPKKRILGCIRGFPVAKPFRRVQARGLLGALEFQFQSCSGRLWNSHLGSGFRSCWPEFYTCGCESRPVHRNDLGQSAEIYRHFKLPLATTEAPSKCCSVGCLFCCYSLPATEHEV